MEVFLHIVIFIFGILNLILFFKIWGMTNNVKKLAQRFQEKDEVTLKEARNLYILGDYDAAFDMFRKLFVERMKNEYNSIYNTYSLKDKDKVEEYDKSFQKIKAAYQERFNRLGPKYEFDFSRYDSYDKMTELYK